LDGIWKSPFPGYIHVTAIASNSERNLDFYTEVLVLRLINAQTRLEWIAALDKIESLNPPAVIAGHK
jgi:catechol 2,3-dioxygenase-like lactoylglutathione lyase family enzyme